MNTKQKHGKNPPRAAEVLIWLDDTRDPEHRANMERVWAVTQRPMVFVWARDLRTFRGVFDALVREGATVGAQLAAVFLDDALQDEETGYDALAWLDSQVRERGIPRFELHTQTDDDTARFRLLAGFRNLGAFWSEQERQLGIRRN